MDDTPKQKSIFKPFACRNRLVRGFSIEPELIGGLSQDQQKRWEGTHIHRHFDRKSDHDPGLPSRIFEIRQMSQIPGQYILHREF